MCRIGALILGGCDPARVGRAVQSDPMHLDCGREFVGIRKDHEAHRIQPSAMQKSHPKRLWQTATQRARIAIRKLYVKYVACFFRCMS